MPAQTGYYDTLKSIAGKVFTFLSTITLTGTDGKTVTVTQDTSLDEAVAMSSKAPKASPVFTGNATAPGIFTVKTTAEITVTPSTLFTPADTATYLLFGTSRDQASDHCAVLIITRDATAFLIDLGSSVITISLSGMNVQASHNAGGTITLRYSYLRIPQI